MAKSPRAPEAVAAAAMRRRLLWVVGVVTFAGIVAVAVAVPVTTVNRARNRVQLQSRNTPGPAGGTNAANAAAAQPPPAGSPARNSGNSQNVAAASATRSALVPPNTAAPEYQAPGRACNGVKGLCEVPVRYALFGGTHNSNSIRAVPAVFENQKLGFLAQLQQGVRVFDLDYSGQSNGRFAHCANCFCGYAPAAADALASSVFKTMGDFLTANPREVLVLGMSNVNCGSANGGVAGARAELLGALAQSSLNQYLPSSAVGPDTTLGQLVDSGQRALLVFYDQWGNTAGHTVGDKFVPAQPFLRYYGGGTTVDASGPAAIDAAAAQLLTSDLGTQFSSNVGASTAALRVPFRIAGYFPSTCWACRSPVQCGPISCAIGLNREAVATYLLGSITATWASTLGSSSKQLLPAFNAFQVDYWEQPVGQPAVGALVQRLNTAWAWLYAEQPSAVTAGLGLANCVWVLDDSSYSGLLLCVHHGRTNLSAPAGSSRRVLVPANAKLALAVTQGSNVVSSIQGSADAIRVVPLSGPFSSLQVTWSNR